MTNITFKNGLPLLLQPAPGSDIGLVAADSGCCCPPPPPERCWCGSFCSYSISVVEPLQATARGFICNMGFDSDSTTVNPSLLDAITGADPTMSFGESFSLASASSGTGRLLAYVVDNSAGVSPDFSYSDIYETHLRATRQVQVLVFCTLEEGQPKFYATISLEASVSFDVTFNSFGDWVRTYLGTFEIPSTCVVSPEKECEPELVGNVEFRRIDTPLEITLSGDGTSSLGSLTMTNDSGAAGDAVGDAEGLVDAILEATNYTFRITARENCLPPENVCCCLENTVTVNTAEECDGTTSPVADPVVDLEDITIVVDWDGLTLTLEHPFFSGSASEGVDFSCLKPTEEEAFDAEQRSLTANFFPQNTGDCRWFSSNINATFIGKYPSNNFDVSAQSSQLAPYVGECKLLAPVDEDDTSCTFVESGSWCMDNPFSDSVTVEMIIAP